MLLVGMDAESYYFNDPYRGTCVSYAKELAEIYTSADVFVNPTYEDNYPTVNLEARACGTKVITYNTGGCSETLM